MRQLVVISGKGGTGKTSVTASFAVLARGEAVLADCDVDAADLHLVLEPEVIRTEEFVSGHRAVIRQDDCIGCGACLARCRFDAVTRTGRGAGEATFEVIDAACEGCGVCAAACPVDAIDFPDEVCGQWFVSRTRAGMMVHARLGIGAENSGKLVSTVRREALAEAERTDRRMVLIDGPPGIGCPVIASVTDTDYVVVVTEPGLSGLHDLKRVMDLLKHFKVPGGLVINRADINEPIAREVETLAAERGLPLLGRIRYDRSITRAQVAGRAVVELDDAPSAEDMRSVWHETMKRMDDLDV